MSRTLLVTKDLNKYNEYRNQAEKSDAVKVLLNREVLHEDSEGNLYFDKASAAINEELAATDKEYYEAVSSFEVDLKDEDDNKNFLEEFPDEQNPEGIRCTLYAFLDFLMKDSIYYVSQM